jgi:hypothetical protein
MIATAATDDSSPDKMIPVNKAVSDVSGKRVNPSTIFRWMTKGLEGLDGNRIRLQVWYVGRIPHTTNAAIRKFVAEQTAAKLERSRRAKQGAAEVTDAELDAAGLLGKRRLKN